MVGLFEFRIDNWPRPARYLYFSFSSLTFRSYLKWCSDGEPNPFVTIRRVRPQQTNEQEIADIFAMTSKELAAFGRAQAGGLPARAGRVD